MVGGKNSPIEKLVSLNSRFYTVSWNLNLTMLLGKYPIYSFEHRTR